MTSSIKLDSKPIPVSRFSIMWFLLGKYVLSPECKKTIYSYTWKVNLDFN